MTYSFLPRPACMASASPISYGVRLISYYSQGITTQCHVPVAFCVRSVQNIVWNHQPFDDLVLPNRQHELIKSLVAVHSGSLSFDDFVRGRGHGLVINLFGKPGVGKTLTVEAVSDRTFMPIYKLHEITLYPQILNVPYM